jgi:lipopolysaccharide/colanic/teichoic acid biosynthesis glycosyltransferase
MYKNLIKPFFDSFAAFCGLVLLFPILLIITIILYFSNDGQPFFFQLRPGRNGKIFKIIKFKTMNDRKDAEGNLLSDTERLTKMGQFVRRTSIDEIPQLWNVMNGQMSLIGPRPLLTQYYHLYNDFQIRRHEVKPGITGWAQVNGRNTISWDEKFKYDVFYVDNIGFIFDCKIFIKTILKVIKSEGINPNNATETEPFNPLKN